jgi:hypothetical protein
MANGVRGSKGERFAPSAILDCHGPYVLLQHTVNVDTLTCECLVRPPSCWASTTSGKFDSIRKDKVANEVPTTTTT